jgi:transposase
VQAGKVGNAEQMVRVGARSDTRLRRSVQEKRQMVEATLEPGTSVARVALAYGVNANLLFYWRKLYREGRLIEGKKLSPTAPRLLPVRIADPSSCELINCTPAPAKPQATTPTIRIELAGQGRLSIEGFDEHSLRTVLEYWLR